MRGTSRPQQRIEEDYKSQRDSITAEGERLRSDLEEKGGEASEEDITFRSVTLVEEGEVIGEKILDQLDELLDQELSGEQSDPSPAPEPSASRSLVAARRPTATSNLSTSRVCSPLPSV